MQPFRVGFLGYGPLGSAVADMLKQNADSILRKAGASPRIVSIWSESDVVLPEGAKRVATPEEIIDDVDIQVIVELLDSSDQAAHLVERALDSGKHVVTANKELLCKHGGRLIARAKQLGLDLHYEATIGVGIPIVQPLKHQLAGNDVLRMMGVLNWTTNYVLSRMQDDNLTLAEALNEAKSKGYTEANPTDDIDGYDTAQKIAILASIAFHQHVPLADIHRESMGSISKIDLDYADRFGYTIKLLGIVDAVSKGKVFARVHPTLLPKSHMLAHVNGIANALFLQGDFVGDLMFSGRGGNSNSVASALVGDLVDSGRNILAEGSGSAIPFEEEAVEVCPIGKLVTSFYLRVTVSDDSTTLGDVAAEFGRRAVSISTMKMKPLSSAQTEIVMLTHPCEENELRDALTILAERKLIDRVDCVIRVEG